ncbi:MAG: hypothetical protein E7468_03445 [Ruminococcaceae bacterium]|nr:hypothetical protein [Oscillospiraceae bacterium]
MSKNDWEFIFPRETWKTLATLNMMRLQDSALAISQAWQTAIPNYDLKGITAALEQCATITKDLSKTLFPEKTVLGLTDAIIAMQSVKMSSIAASILPDIDTSVYTALQESVARASADWSWLSGVYTEDRDNDENADATETVAEQSVAPEIRDRIAADITQVLSEPETMHVTSKNKYLQWMQESPGNALQFLNTLISIIMMIFAALSLGIQARQARPVKDSQVYEEPAATSSVVYNITVENNVTVIGDKPYYYEVEFVNPETGELVTGYIYKGNITLEEPEETVNPEDEPEDPESTEPTGEESEGQVESEE